MSPARIGVSEWTTPGHIKHIRQPYLIAVCEGRTWKGEGDPEVRASGYVLYALRRALLDGKDPLDLLPCIIVYLVGSTFYFSGTVLTDRFQLETMALAPPLDTSFYLHSLDTKMARAFGAFRIAVAQLHRHYDDMSVANDNSNPTERLARAARLALPYLDSYTGEGKEVKLTYDYRLNERKLMFIATTTEGPRSLSNLLNDILWRHIGFVPKLMQLLRFIGFSHFQEGGIWP